MRWKLLTLHIQPSVHGTIKLSLITYLARIIAINYIRIGSIRWRCDVTKTKSGLGVMFNGWIENNYEFFINYQSLKYSYANFKNHALLVTGIPILANHVTWIRLGVFDIWWYEIQLYKQFETNLKSHKLMKFRCQGVRYHGLYLVTLSCNTPSTPPARNLSQFNYVHGNYQVMP